MFYFSLPTLTVLPPLTPYPYSRYRLRVEMRNGAVQEDARYCSFGCSLLLLATPVSNLLATPVSGYLMCEYCWLHSFWLTGFPQHLHVSLPDSKLAETTDSPFLTPLTSLTGLGVTK